MKQQRTLDQIWDSMERSIDKVLSPNLYFDSLRTKMKRLEKLNLIRTLDYKNAVEELEKETESQRLTQEEQEHLDKISKMRNYYEFNYPQFKFLTPEELEELCRELKIVIGHLEYFESGVPNYILDELENLSELKFEEYPYIPTHSNNVNEEWLKRAFSSESYFESYYKIYFQDHGGLRIAHPNYYHDFPPRDPNREVYIIFRYVRFGILKGVQILTQWEVLLDPLEDKEQPQQDVLIPTESNSKDWITKVFNILKKIYELFKNSNTRNSKV